MKIMVKSQKENEWVRDGYDINYSINDFQNSKVKFTREDFVMNYHFLMTLNILMILFTFLIHNPTLIPI